MNCMETNETVKIGMIALGCNKNQVDAELMLGALEKEGFEIVENAAECDVVIVNTCGFIESAKRESIENILQCCQLKEQGYVKLVVVTGCLAERYRGEILESISEVDAILGTASFDEIAEVLKKAEEGESSEVYKELTYLPLPESKRVNTTCGYTAYLKIADGCEKFCT